MTKKERFMSNAFFPRTLLLLLFSIFCSSVYAQEYNYEVGGMVGGASYMGDLNKTVPLKGLNPAVGAVFRYNVNFRVAMKASLLWATVSGSTDGQENVFPGQATGSFQRNLLELGGQMEFNFFSYSDKFAYLNTRRLTPYMLAGLGVTAAPGGANLFMSANIPLGVGVKYKLKNRMNIVAKVTVRKLFGDGLEVTHEGNRFLDNPYGISGSIFKNNDWYTLLSLSFTWDFGPRNRTCNSAGSEALF